MKITFTFVGVDDLKSASKYDTFKTHFKFSDNAMHLIGCKERILKIAENVGQLTIPALYVTCKELGIESHLIKLMSSEHQRHYDRFNSWTSVIYFEGMANYQRKQSSLIKIWNPVRPPGNLQQYYGGRGRISSNLLQFERMTLRTEEEQEYARQYAEIIEQSLMLLNASADTNWTCPGCHPRWQDGSIHSTMKKRMKSARKESEKQAKLPEAGTPHPKTGAGRTFGAVPGVFMGVQMRSQLEIRLAAELEERGIKWIYEEERLGDGNYLVDFHLPDLKCWIEAKGKFEARDRFLLKEVAEMLDTERGEKLYAYTSRRGYVITKDEFISMKHSEFWDLLQNES